MVTTLSNQENFTYSGKNSPCPICGRTKAQDCRWKDEVVFCHTDVDRDAKIEGFVYRDATHDKLWGQYFVKSLDQQKSIRPKSTKEYFYPDRNGNPLIKVVRIDDGNGKKDFPLSHWNRESWIVGLTDGVKRQVPIYRYREVKKAITRGEEIFVVEGEVCADDLWNLGIPATTTLGGSGKYCSYGNYFQDLKDAQLVLCPDRDQLGIEYMEKIAQDFPSARWAYVYPDSPLWERLPKNRGLDISDWIASGATVEQILASIGEKRQHNINQNLENTKLGKDRTFEEVLDEIDKINQLSDPGERQRELRKLARLERCSLKELLAECNMATRNQPKFELIDALDLLSKSLDKFDWLIAGLLPMDTTALLYADGGTGKTLLTYSLIKAIACSQQWNGFPTKQGKVLLFQTDEPSIVTTQSMKVANFQEELKAGQLFITHNWQFAQMDKLAEAIKLHKPALVVIDSLTSSNRNSSTEEKDVEYGRCLYELRDLAMQFHCAILILHHENKTGGVRGSTALKDNVSEVWHLKRDSHLNQLQRVLDIESI